MVTEFRFRLLLEGWSILVHTVLEEESACRDQLALPVVRGIVDVDQRILAIGHNLFIRKPFLGKGMAHPEHLTDIFLQINECTGSRWF